MKQNLNEQLSRIKSMIKMVNEQDYTPQTFHQDKDYDLELPSEISSLFQKYGFQVMNRSQYAFGDREHTLVFDNDIPSFGIAFDGGILKLEPTDYRPLRDNLKRQYTFEFNRDSMSFELSILNDFLDRVTQILLKGKDFDKQQDDEQRQWEYMNGEYPED
jgi:hypothetical protein